MKKLMLFILATAGIAFAGPNPPPPGGKQPPRQEPPQNTVVNPPAKTGKSDRDSFLERKQQHKQQKQEEKREQNINKQHNNFGPQPPQNNFGPQPPQNNFGPQPPQNNFGPQPPQNNFGPKPPQNNFGPKPPYKPGYSEYEFNPRPNGPEHYRHWHRADPHYDYRMRDIPSEMQVFMKDETTFKLHFSEDTSTGEKWFARYDKDVFEIDIDHARAGWFDAEAFATIKIRAKFPGDSMIEFIHADRSKWERGHAPHKVVHVYVHVEPKF